MTAPSTDLVITRPAIEELVWIVSPEDAEAYDVWTRCQNNWLDDIEARSKAKNTRRAYAADYAEFFAHWRHMNLLPWQVGRIHAQGWVQHLRQRGLADSTINRKVAALSSFYRYASDEFQIQTPRGPRGLWPHPNPFGSKKLRSQIEPYANSLPFPSTGQIDAMLNVIPVDTVNGLRDLALLMGLFVTTRRVSEWRSLKWGDLEDDDEGGKVMTYRYKGGKVRRQSIPPELWQVVELYVRQSGRWPLHDDDYVFIAHHDAGKHLPTNGAGYDPANQPISARRVNAIFKSYGRKVGIRDEALHAHALRHAGARARRKAGADVYALRDILGHSNIAITQIYSDNRLDKPEDSHGAAIVAAVMPKQLKLKFSR